MPVDQKQTHQLDLSLPTGLQLDAGFFVVRFTGEIFTSYECAPVPSPCQLAAAPSSPMHPTPASAQPQHDAIPVALLREAVE